MKRINTGNTELRKVFSDTLSELMDKDSNVMYLEADLGGAIGTSKLLAEKPGQAIDIGIMEANMIGVAAGMSVKGKIPFVHSFGTFTTRRCADQVFLSGCYNKANVNIIGSDPGITAESNGGTHMPLEDVAVFRAFPEMRIFDVAEPSLLRFVLETSAKEYGMTYTRFPRKLKKTYYPENQKFELGRGIILKDGTDVSIVASGIEVFEAIDAMEKLEAMGISVELIDMFTIKPLDEQLIIESAKKTGAVVTAENHNIIGGLGSAVAEVLMETYPVPMKRIGTRDHFGEVGDQKYLSKKFHLSSEDIVAAALGVVSLKRV
ncbi:MAG: transketolase C-terminal domain-containing protein [Oscillospiraceae bacterium]